MSEFAKEPMMGMMSLRRHEDFQDKVLRKLDRIEQEQHKLMTDISGLTAAIDKLDADEVAAVAELHTLAAKIGELEVGQVTQAQLDELTAHAEAVSTALEAGTASP